MGFESFRLALRFEKFETLMLQFPLRFISSNVSGNCMKTVANILLIIGLWGCGQQKSKDCIVKTQDTVMQTMRDIEREIKILGLPIGFSVDTLHNFDKSRNLEIFVSI